MSLGKKALSVLMSVVLVMGLNPGFAVANTGGGSTTAGNIAAQAQVVARFNLNYTGAPAYNEQRTVDTTQKYNAQQNITWPVPTRDGYTFAGWKTEANDNDSTYVVEYNAATKTATGKEVDVSANGDFTLYAGWTATQSTVKLNVNAPEGVTIQNTSPAEITVAYGSTYGQGTYKKDGSDATVGALPEPTDSTGKYTFVGWFTEKAGGTEIQGGTTVSIVQNQILYAHWSDATYRLSFSAGTGATVSPASKMVAFGAEYGELPTPTRSGYEFAGWWSSNGAAGTEGATWGTQVTSATKLTTAEATTIYAKWLNPTIEITLDGNGGVATPSKLIGVTTSTYGKLLESKDAATDVALSTVSVTRPDLYFEYKATKDAESTTKVENYVMASSSSGSDTAAATTKEPLIAWYATPEAARNETAIVDTTPVTTSSPRTLYARWTPANWNMTLDYQGGKKDASVEAEKSETSSVSVTYNDTYVNAKSGNTVVGLGTPVRDGYTFDGWFTEPNDGKKTNPGVQVTEGDVVKHLTHPKAAAQSTAPGTGESTGSDDKSDDNSDDNSGEGAENNLSPAAEGDTTAATGEIELVNTLYAHWTPISYTVTLDLQGGKVAQGESTTLDVTVDGYYGKLPVPTRDGYKLQGWYYKAEAPSDANTQVIGADGDGARKTVPGPTDHGTLYAYWGDPATFKINYELTGGSEKTGSAIPSSLKEYKMGQTVTLPTSTYIEREIPESAGTAFYTFVGWHKTADLSDDVITTLPADTSGDITLYAEWAGDATNRLYTVKFDSDGGDDVAPQQVAAGGKVAFPAVYKTQTGENGAVTVVKDNEGNPTIEKKLPERKGYVLVDDREWTLNGSVYEWVVSDDAYVSKSAVNSNITLKANWQGAPITVTFNQNYGDEPTTTESSVRYGSTFGALTSPTRTGYVFGGWWTNNGDAEDNDSEDWGTQVTSTTVLNDDIIDLDTANNAITLHAKWNPNSYTITLNPDGGTLKSGFSTSFSATNGEEYGDALPTADDISKDGYEFAGWYKDRVNTGNVITPESKVDISANTTLVAAWQAKTVKVTYHDFDQAVNKWVETPGEGFVKTLSYGGTYPTVASAAEGTTTTGSDGEATTTIPDYFTGYAFDGWYTAQVGGAKVAAGSTVNLTENQDLYARAKGKTSYVTLKSDNSANSPSSTVVLTYGDSYKLNAPAAVAGKKFIGWKNGEADVESEGIWASPDNVTLVGQWENISYTINLDAGLNDVSSATPTAIAGYAKANDAIFWTKTIAQASAAEALPTADGITTPQGSTYTFAGWYDNPGLTGTAVRSVPANTDEDQTFYAKWNAPSGSKVVTLAFDMQGADPLPSIQQSVASNASATFNFSSQNNTVSSAENPYRAGFTFKGWHLNSLSSAALASTTTSVTRSADTVLIAEWEGATFNITLDVNGGKLAATDEAKLKVENGGTYGDAYYGEGVSKVKTGLPTPTRDGYTFVGWYTEKATDPVSTQDDAETPFTDWGDEVNNETDVPETAKDGTVTLHAKWTPATYTVTFDAKGGTVTPASSNITPQATGAAAAASKTVVLPTPERENYTFAGWVADEADLDDDAATLYAAGALYPPTVAEGETAITVTEDITLYAKWTAETFKLDLDYDDGYLGKDKNGVTLYNPDEYTAETATFSLQNPEKVGYDFAGWLDQNADNPTPQMTVTIAQGSTGDKAFKATWTPKSYRIVFLDDTGAEISSANYPFKTLKSDIVIPEVGTRTLDGVDYKFVKWNPIVTDVVGDATYTAERENAGAHQLKLDVNEDSLLGATNKVAATYAVTNPNYTLPNPEPGSNNPKLEGLTFTGYYLKGDVVAPATKDDPYTPKEGAKKIERVVGPLGIDYTGDNELYATWAPTEYTIEYVLDAGTNNEDNPATFTSKDKKFDLADAKKDGYKFLGWYTAATGGTKVETIDPSNLTSFTITDGTITLYAVWSAKLVKIADIADQLVGFNESNLKLHVYDAAGKEIDETSTTGGTTTTNYRKVFTGQRTAGTATVTVTGAGDYAGTTLTATFNVIDVPGDVTSLRAQIAAAQAMLDATTAVEDPSEDVAKLASGTYYATDAQCKAMNSAIIAATNVSNNVNPSESDIETAARNLDKAVNGYTDATDTSKDVTGFANERKLVTTTKDALTDLVREADADIAKYIESVDGTDVPKRTEDGEPQMWLSAKDMKAYQDAIDAAKAVLADEAASQEAVDDAVKSLRDDDDNKKGAMDDAAEAALQGTKKSVYTFTFYANGGIFENDAESYSVEVTEGDKVPEPTMKVIREGWGFKYWAKADANKSKFNFDVVPTDTDFLSTTSGTKVVYDFNMDLLADWAQVDYQITYNLNGGTWKAGKIPTTTESTYNVQYGKQSLKSGSDITPPTETGYTFTFVGWYDNASFAGDPVLKIEAGTMGDRTFWAQWKKVKADAADGTTYTKNDVTLTSEALATEALPEGDEIRFDVSNLSSNNARVNSAVSTVVGLDSAAKDVLDNAAGKFLFDVDLKVVKSANTSVVDQEATDELKDNLKSKPLTLEFYVGASYAGSLANVYHVHDGSTLIPIDPVTVNADGYIVVTGVDQLSEFLIAISIDKAAAEKAIADAKAAVDAVIVSEDGSDVPEGTKWVTQSTKDAALKAIADAEDALKNADTQADAEKAAADAAAAAKALTDAAKDGAALAVYRLYNPNSGEHFYTLDAAERDDLVKAGWNDENVGWYAPKTGDAVYRLYNPNAGEHHYTTDAQERDDLVKIGWNDEGELCKSAPSTGVPLYRDYNPNAFANNHNYTTDVSEHEALEAAGWNVEGIGWYAVRAGA